jgi:hydroxymethylglutaryl-CoA synthase
MKIKLILPKNNIMQVGIDLVSFSIPKIHLPIDILAQNRNIEPEKLIKGLGLQKMTLLDVHQDVVTMASNAVLQLITENNLDCNHITRIYVGSESGVDSSKPIASYIVNLLESRLGENKFTHCDVVDLTFACIGAVDALQNCIDYIRLNPDEKAIVVATDLAKYDLESTGEYTQGAGAIALLVSSNPRIISFSSHVGVSTQGVFDFFKPRQSIEKQLITGNQNNENWQGIVENEVTFYKEQPVFDGQYSNTCYINRIVDAYQKFKAKSNSSYQNWNNFLMHLPYCFQGRRTFLEIIAAEAPELIAQETGENYKEKLKNFSKSDFYKNLVQEKIYPSEIASAQVGNIYTGSIFLGFLSTLFYFKNKNEEIFGQKFGFIAYGSGSKSKVFEGIIQENWKTALVKLDLFKTLNQSKAIDFETYLKLHKKEQKTSILQPKNEFSLVKIEKENSLLLGARFYEYKI